MTLKEKFDNIISQCIPIDWENKCEDVADEFAIGFAEWILKKCSYSEEDSKKGLKYYIKGLDGLALYYPTKYTIGELLEIYKRENEL